MEWTEKREVARRVTRFKPIRFLSEIKSKIHKPEKSLDDLRQWIIGIIHVRI